LRYPYPYPADKNVGATVRGLSQTAPCILARALNGRTRACWQRTLTKTSPVRLNKGEIGLTSASAESAKKSLNVGDIECEDRNRIMWRLNGCGN
jgi:hypothetical protein